MFSSIFRIRARIVQQIQQCLKPNGLLFLTTPGLYFFWSYNDKLARHQRRYAPKDLQSLAHQYDLRLTKVRFFIFFESSPVPQSTLRQKTGGHVAGRSKEASRTDTPGSVEASQRSIEVDFRD